MVVIFFPATWETGVEQERTAAPSTCTVQAPHNPAPQPNFVPVRFKESRKTQSSGVSGETLTLRSLPFTRREMSAMLSPNFVELTMVLKREKKENCGGFSTRKVP